jgi:hypothetical protein
VVRRRGRCRPGDGGRWMGPGSGGGAHDGGSRAEDGVGLEEAVAAAAGAGGGPARAG